METKQTQLISIHAHFTKFECSQVEPAEVVEISPAFGNYMTTTIEGAAAVWAARERGERYIETTAARPVLGSSRSHQPHPH